MRRLHFIFYSLLVFFVSSPAMASTLACGNALKFLSSRESISLVEGEVAKVNLPRPSADSLVETIADIRDEYLRLAFKVDAHKSRALRRVAQKLADLIEELEWGNRDDSLLQRASFIVALVETQKVLKHRLPPGFQAEDLPYLFTEVFQSGRTSVRHGLKIKIRGETHARLFISVRFVMDQGRMLVEVVESHLEDRHAIYR